MTVIAFDSIPVASTQSLTIREVQECSLFAQEKKKNSGEYVIVVTSWYMTLICTDNLEVASFIPALSSINKRDNL